ncbi:MAG: hypothetical protein IKF09_08190, partial [Clostridiales bacterium]|nr:hypothetical protein [Clostridiales bacterium]
MAVKKSASLRKGNTSGKAGTAVKKTAEKKATVKKTAAKKTATKKTADKKASVKVSSVKKSEPKNEVKTRLSSFVASPEITDPGYSEASASFLSGNDCFYNRELSWLEFDDRILH